jgi:anti-sigma B factor antagonist
MQMQITERAVGNVTILDLSGPLTGGGGTERLKDKVNSLVLQKRVQLVVNLGGVAQIDSAGLGEIVTCLTTVSKAGGKLKLLNLTKRNQDLLSITRLVTVFDTFDSEADAVRSFGAAPGA